MNVWMWWNGRAGGDLVSGPQIFSVTSSDNFLGRSDTWIVNAVTNCVLNLDFISFDSGPGRHLHLLASRGEEVQIKALKLHSEHQKRCFSVLLHKRSYIICGLKKWGDIRTLNLIFSQQIRITWGLRSKLRIKERSSWKKLLDDCLLNWTTVRRDADR